MSKVSVAVGDLSLHQLGEVLRQYGINPSGTEEVRRKRLTDYICQQAGGRGEAPNIDSMSFEVSAAPESVDEDTVRRIVEETLENRDEALLKKIGDLMSAKLANVGATSKRARRGAKTGQSSRRAGAAAPSRAQSTNDAQEEPENEDGEDLVDDDPSDNAFPQGFGPLAPAPAPIVPLASVPVTPPSTVVVTSTASRQTVTLASAGASIMSTGVTPSSYVQTPLTQVLNGQPHFPTCQPGHTTAGYGGSGGWSGRSSRGGSSSSSPSGSRHI